MKSTVKKKIIFWAVGIFSLILIGILCYGLCPRDLVKYKKAYGEKYSYEKVVKELGTPTAYFYDEQGKIRAIEYFDRYILPNKSIRFIFDPNNNLEECRSIGIRSMFTYAFPGFQKHGFLSMGPFHRIFEKIYCFWLFIDTRIKILIYLLAIITALAISARKVKNTIGK